MRELERNRWKERVRDKQSERDELESERHRGKERVRDKLEGERESERVGRCARERDGG